MAVTGNEELPGAPLVEHLRELRRRLTFALLAIALGTVVGWVFYDATFAFLSEPFDHVVEQAQAQGREVTLALTGVSDPFVLQIQVAAVTGLVLSTPVWLYQLWRFVTPGLHRHERRWGIAFAGAATPLFLAGVALAYTVLPIGLELLLGFTPANVENIVSVDRYFSFFLRSLLVFGVGFLTPLMLVLLNFAGIVSARAVLRNWRWILVVIVLFSAVATPTGDPVNLTLLAVPIMLLMSVAVAVMAVNDRRRARRLRRRQASEVPDDEASPLLS